MMDQIELAKQIATEAHLGQFRWDGKTPYISHPAAIAKKIEIAYRCYDNPHFHLGFKVDDAVATAWLHDVVEDTPLTINDLRAKGVSDSILEGIKLLTKQDGESYLYYLLRLKKNPLAQAVKVEDIRHNMSDLDKKRKKSMYEKYELALYILCN